MLELDASCKLLLQRSVHRLQLARALVHARLELIVALAQDAHRVAAFLQRGAEHQSGHHQRDHEREQRFERNELAAGRQRATAVHGMPDGERAHARDRGGHLALREAQPGPQHERHHEVGEPRQCLTRRIRPEHELRGAERENRPAGSLEDPRCAPVWAHARSPRERERRHDQDAGQVALPPREPVCHQLAPGQRMRERERKPGDRGRDERAHGRDDEKCQGVAGGFQTLRAPFAQQRVAADRFQRVAGADQHRGKQGMLDREVRSRGAEPDSWPDSGAHQQACSEREAGGRP